MKKIVIAVICAVLLFIPTYVAIAYYGAAQNKPVDATVVTKMDLRTPTGESYSFSRDDTAIEPSVEGGMIKFFTGLGETSKDVSELPAPLVGTDCYEVDYFSYDKKTTFRYYFSTDPSYAYYTDQNGKAFRISTASAEQFLQTPYALCLYPTSKTPVMTLAGTGILTPASMEWSYLDFSNQYQPVTPRISDATATCNVAGAMDLSFDIQPDYLLVSMTDAKTGAVVFDDLYENLRTDLFDDNAVYSVAVTAKWYESTGRGACGDASYRFVANVLAPAVFYVGETTVDPGEFIVISAKNIVDPAEITFTSTPDIGFTPTFSGSGEYVHALIPISIDLTYSDSYTFTVGYGGVTETMTVAVNNKNFIAQTQTLSTATITSFRSAKALADFDATINPYLEVVYDDLYWLDAGAFSEPVNGRNVRTGFGLYLTLASTGTQYRHEGVNYVVSPNDKIVAAIGGKVIYVGETTLSGRTIIVDHGAGLKSLYAHLSSSVVNVGDIVEKGQELGTVGSTGFTEGTSLHYGLYVKGVPVCPYDLWEKGVVINSAAR